jgi:hypothetical protein
MGRNASGTPRAVRVERFAIIVVISADRADEWRYDTGPVMERKMLSVVKSDSSRLGFTYPEEANDAQQIAFARLLLLDWYLVPFAHAGWTSHEMAVVEVRFARLKTRT